MSERLLAACLTLLCLLFLPCLSAASVPARAGRGPMPPESPECVQSLQFEAEDGKSILTGLTGSFDAGVYAAEDAVYVRAQSSGGEFQVVFASGALKAIKDGHLGDGLSIEPFAFRATMAAPKMMPERVPDLR